MRILITGAFGFIGGRLAEWLEKSGHHVGLTDRWVPNDAGLWARRYDVRLADLLDPASIARVVNGFDAVVHLAALNENDAQRDPALALRVSRDGTRDLLAAAARAGVQRFVFFSTFHVYGGSTGAFLETTAVRPTHPYAMAHWEGEKVCEAAAVRSVVLRLSNSYGCPVRLGVDRWTLAHNDFCAQAVRDGRIVLKSHGLQHRDFVWIDDVSWVVSAVCSGDDSRLGDGVFNVGGDCSLSILQLAERVQTSAQELLGYPIPIERAPAPSGERSEPVVFPTAKLKQAIGFAPHDEIDRETRLLVTRLRDA